MRVNCWIDKDLLSQIDKCADEQGLTRSQFMSLCCTTCMILPLGLSKMKTKKNLLKAMLNDEIDLSTDEKEKIITDIFVDDKKVDDK